MFIFLTVYIVPIIFILLMKWMKFKKKETFITITIVFISV